MDVESIVNRIKQVENELDVIQKKMINIMKQNKNLIDANEEIKQKVIEERNNNTSYINRLKDKIMELTNLNDNLKKVYISEMNAKDSYLIQLELMQAGIDRTAQDMEHLKQFKIKFLMQENPGYSFYNEHDPIPSSEIGKDIILIDNRCVITRIIKKYNSNGSQSTIVFNNDD
jgi:regulator of replication initiation timing